MTCVAPRHGDSSRDGILATYSCSLCLKKNQNAPRPSEHPPVKTFRWDHRLFVVRALCFYLYFLRTINTINTVPGIYLIIATWKGGGGLRCQTFSFLFSFPCSADHERNTGMLLCIVKYSNCRFLGLATNTPNVRNKNVFRQFSPLIGWMLLLMSKIRLHGRRGKGMAESFSREKLRHAPQKEGG